MVLSAALYSASIQSLNLYAARLNSTMATSTTRSTTAGRRLPAVRECRCMASRRDAASLGGGLSGRARRVRGGVIDRSAARGQDGEHLAIVAQFGVVGVAGTRDADLDGDRPGRSERGDAVGSGRG